MSKIINFEEMKKIREELRQKKQEKKVREREKQKHFENKLRVILFYATELISMNGD